MGAKNVCDFCLSEGTGLFGRPERLPDGHRICKNCRRIIKDYGRMPLKYDIFQCLVTAEPHMTGMIMGTFLENRDPDDIIARHYPLPVIPLHEGEHCINESKATLIVNAGLIPEEDAVRDIDKISHRNINDISDFDDPANRKKVAGTLYETEVALYFMSDKFINCHRLGYILRNTDRDDRVVVKTPHHTFTYYIEHADLFFLRERFFRKVQAEKHHNGTGLVYIRGENDFSITPGVYDIPQALKPGRYRVMAINDAGLHMKDALGRETDYYANDNLIDLEEGGVLECTGEYELQWVGSSNNNK